MSFVFITILYGIHKGAKNFYEVLLEIENSCKNTEYYVRLMVVTLFKEQFQQMRGLANQLQEMKLLLPR
jgi:hypothetical protein